MADAAGLNLPSGVVFTNAYEVAASLLQRSGRETAAMLGVVRTMTALLETRVKANASGRPGPNVITGDYRRRIVGQVVRDGGSVVGRVGTNAVQARRLEFGFFGQDRIGRSFHQPPYAHFGPAFDTIAPAFTAALAEVIGK